ncbi:hypothetical protein EYF80_054763 [Liparis tanakae]|uniref:Uncharacterized protein n=1 Tax=Liparis tanakae TaxID=230148 RepID=A0A4Z2F2T3_9TELE|nr:hypothetical protein EYF80_054763 [Liparis tanakae]
MRGRVEGGVGVHQRRVQPVILVVAEDGVGPQLVDRQLLLQQADDLQLRQKCGIPQFPKTRGATEASTSKEKRHPVRAAMALLRPAARTSLPPAVSRVLHVIFRVNMRAAPPRSFHLTSQSNEKRGHEPQPAGTQYHRPPTGLDRVPPRCLMLQLQPVHI